MMFLKLSQKNVAIILSALRCYETHLERCKTKFSSLTPIESVELKKVRGLIHLFKSIRDEKNHEEC